MSRQRAAVLLAASILLGLVVGNMSPIGELGLVAAFAVFVWVARAVPGFGGAVGRGLVAGAVAGVAVMGVGFRLAMRIVALTDPVRTPEFSVGGTMFILVGIGIMLGAFAGAYLAGFRHLLGLGARTVAVVAAVALSLILFGDSETRDELFELGLGAWLNIPMFGSILFAYGYSLHAILHRFDRRAVRSRSVSDVVDPAPVP